MSWDAYPDPGDDPDASADPKHHFPHTLAKFDGSCPGCSWYLEQDNDLVFKVDGEWFCVECAQEAVAEGRTP